MEDTIWEAYIDLYIIREILIILTSDKTWEFFKLKGLIFKINYVSYP